MRCKVLVLIVCLLGVPGISAASQASHRAAAEKLLQVTHMQQTLDMAMQRMLAVQVQSQPQLQPYKQVMLDFLRKYMGFKSIKDDLVALYVRNFSEKELDDIVAFYETPSGQKAVSKLPVLMSEGAQLGVRRVQAHLDELRAMIRAEQARQQSAAPAQPAQPAGH